MSIRDHVAEKIAATVRTSKAEVVLEHPEQESFGDYSTNIALKQKGGRKRAEEIVSLIKPDDVIAKTEVAGPGFINIWIQKDYLVKHLGEVLTQASGTKKKDSRRHERVVIDYSSPNIAKPFGIGHLRSTIIGQALYNTYKYLGYEVTGDNHLGDWGTQFGKLLYMIDKEKPKKLDIDILEKLYVDFHQLEEKDETLEEKAREWFLKLEQGDREARLMWKKCWEVSMEEFDRIYELLGVKIDETLGESFYKDKVDEVIDEAKAKGIAEQSEGAWVIEIPEVKVPLMLVKSDGGTTYATRDLATIKYRMQKWSPTKIIYEVGSEHGLHFEQVFTAARLLGYVSEAVRLEHTKHGLYLDTDGKKFSTRKGKTVKLEDILLEAIERAGRLGDGVAPEVARGVGIGAIKYFDLKHGVQSDIVFDWEKMFALEGNSGPYLQYTFARTQSVLAKSRRAGEFKSISGYEPNEEEMAVLRWIYRFEEVVEEAAERLAPNLICNFVYELAQRFNTFYNKHSILSPESGRVEELESVRNFRLVLTEAVGKTLKDGLNLLGIEVLERM